GQQQEISVAVRNGVIKELSPDQVRDLVASTEATLGTWALALHRELHRETTDLRVVYPGIVDEPVYRRPAPTTRLDRTLTALAEHRTVDADPIAVHAADARMSLRQTLTRTPSIEADTALSDLDRRHHDRR